MAFALDGRRIVSGSNDETVRVWDAETAVCLDIIQGQGDISAIAAGPRAHSFRAMVRGPETVIETTAGGVAVAWFPAALKHLSTHASALIWGGTIFNHLDLIRLEGAVS